MWNLFDNGGTSGQQGLENGAILRDEENPLGVRITLELDTATAPFAITCGIYGWMFHTRFFSVESEALGQFEAMKNSLSEILTMMPPSSDEQSDAKTGGVSEAIGFFISRYP